MDLLHVFVGLALFVVPMTQSRDPMSDPCGCILTDPTEIAKNDYVCDPIRTPDFQNFLNRLKTALFRHWIAYTFIKTIPDQSEPPQEDGEALCPVERKKILGYFKNDGLTLCWIVDPHLQNIQQAECCGERCCGQNTRCEPGGFVLKKFLVYCDALYTDEDGCLIGTDELRDTMPDCIHRRDDDDGGGDDDDDDDDDSSGSGSGGSGSGVGDDEGGDDDGGGDDGGGGGSGSGGGDDNGGSFCPRNHWYFGFKHEFLPSICSCRRCDC